MPPSAVFHSSTTPRKPLASSVIARTPSPQQSPMAAGAPSEVTEAAFSRWRVELQNKLIVEQEKASQEERRQYKQREDSKYWERKQQLHKKTADQFGKAKMEVEAIRQANLTRGAEYKAELEEMKEMAAQQREEWMQLGHELTVQHGPEQMERTKARLAEAAEQKAEQGRQVKQTAQLNNKARHVQRTNALEQKRAIVEGTKNREFSAAEESKNYSFHQKEEMGGEVRRTERKWKSLSKQERDQFLSHAQDNHEKNDSTKEHMRDARKDIIKKRSEAASALRERKVEDAMKIAERKEQMERLLREQRDMMYSTKYADPEKAKLMSQPPNEAASLAGITVQPKIASPYRLT